jgi:glycine/D-amino acid oxidase-like deaminating enzyme
VRGAGATVAVPRALPRACQDWPRPGPVLTVAGQNVLMDADLVVIGAGALGLSTALHAAILGESVVVVERETAGSQASGRAAGLFKSVQADELRTGLARRSIDLALRFGDWAAVPLEVAASGSFLIARTSAHRDYLQAEARQSGSWGIEVVPAGPADLASRNACYRGDGREFVLWCPEDVYIEEPVALTGAYAAAARLRGAEILESEAVTGIGLAGGRVSAVETTGRTISTRAVVDAAGAWTRQVAGLAGADLPVAPVRHQLLITAPDPAIDSSGPICRVVDAAVYLRPARGGLMLGGFEAAPLPADPRFQPAGFSTDDLELDAAVLQDFAAQVSAEVPAAVSSPAAEHRGGLFTMSPDGRFVIGPVPGVPGFWVASGCNGSGFSSSLALGEALAGQIFRGCSAIDIGPLSPARFGRLTDEELIRAGVWQYAHYYDPAGTPPPAPPAT